MSNLDDQQALRDLMARYIDAVVRYDEDAWIATWAPDSVWNLLGNPISGRENILALWQQMMQTFEFAIMMPSSCLFQIDGDTASGHWYLHEHTRDTQGKASTILSRYLDTYVRQDGQWLYQSREYNFIYNGAPDLSGDFTRPQ